MNTNKKLCVVKTINNLERIKRSWKGEIGFVPTMGYLHDGHLSLIKKARKENDKVIVSIFVNPKQFNSKNDYKNYPKDTKRDLEILKHANVDCVFLPSDLELYPKEYSTHIKVEEISDILEGKSRTGHFKGVATIVLKLLNVTRADRAYFGQKDIQQTKVIKKMVKDLNLKTKIVVCKTIREKDGLAKSSRNILLNNNQRKEAAVLFESLVAAQRLFKSRIYDCQKIKSEMKKILNKKNCKVDYISIVNPNKFSEVKNAKKGCIVTLAVYFGKIRLIDNIIL